MIEINYNPSTYVLYSGWWPPLFVDTLSAPGAPLFVDTLSAPGGPWTEEMPSQHTGYPDRLWYGCRRCEALRRLGGLQAHAYLRAQGL